MGYKPNKIINDKTSSIRPIKPPPPPAPPPKRVASKVENHLMATKKALLDGLTPVQRDANDVVDQMVDGLIEYIGYDPEKDQSMFRTPDGEIHHVDRAITGTNYNATGNQNIAIGHNALAANATGEQQYTVTELHRFLQELAESDSFSSNISDWDTSSVTDILDMFKNGEKTEKKMGIIPPKVPIRRATDEERAKQTEISESQRRAAEKEAKDLDYWETIERFNKLGMHQDTHVASGTDAMRVPGGLIYYKTEGYGGTKCITSTFVPCPELG